ncbi:uncharacterized protein FIESC28_02105 [Fusarium coffeatum]|uniref:Uncharacterized protein n=1 Tax=Fusarium coffeatum TaxID=231269 RepID=A0A366S788_9HYPO|nr:uncharacterized protein FIESC28_02105 [Fusarium coffeatum]RBR25197.1 hypothetical protein FIESC28_02105 [Fusarium coffeatum]
MDKIPGVFKTWELSSSQQSEVERLLEDTDEMYNLNLVVAYPDFQVLWKTCLRVFRYSPNCLISAINYLQYGGENKQVGKAIFSTAFSKLLSSLIVHPIWDCNYRKLRVALQFVVMCRIESGERWPASRCDTFDCQALELLWERFDELEPGSVSQKLRQALALTPVEEEFPTFLLTISQYVNQKTTDSDINPAYRGLLAYPVEMRDLKSIEQALDNYAWMHEAWRISTQRIWEAFKVERGTSTTEFPKGDQLKEYIPSAVRHIYGYIVRVGVSPTPSPGVDAEGSEGSQISWLDSHGSSDEEVYPTMSGAIDSSGRQRSADSEALRRLEASNHELRAGYEALRADHEALRERVQANEGLIAENERLRRQRNAFRALARRQAREIQVLRQQRT